MDGEDAGIGIAANELAREKIAAMKILENTRSRPRPIREIATGFLLVGRRKFWNVISQHGK